MTRTRRDRDAVADPFPEAVGGVGGVLALVAADLVGREDRPVERADDQRGDPAAADHPQEPVEQDQRQQDEDQQAGADHPQQATDARALDAVRAAPGRRCRRRSGAVSGVCGTKGQKARRPKIVSSAGSRVSIESAAQAIPIAAIGPRPAVPLTLAIVRQSSAAITVAAEAKIAGPGGGEGGPHRLVAGRSVAVELLAVAGDEQQGVVGPRAKTSTDMIELDWPLIVTPSSETPYPIERERVSAKSTAASGIRKNIGER